MISQLHLSDLERLDAGRLDPSLALGFFFANNDEFEDFYEEIKTRNDAKLKKSKNSRMHTNPHTRSDSSVNSSLSLFQVAHTPPSYMCSNSRMCDDMDNDNDGDDNIMLAMGSSDSLRFTPGKKKSIATTASMYSDFDLDDELQEPKHADDDDIDNEYVLV